MSDNNRKVRVRPVSKKGMVGGQRLSSEARPGWARSEMMSEKRFRRTRSLKRLINLLDLWMESLRYE